MNNYPAQLERRDPENAQLRALIVQRAEMCEEALVSFCPELAAYWAERAFALALEVS